MRPPREVLGQRVRHTVDGRTCHYGEPAAPIREDHRPASPTAEAEDLKSLQCQFKSDAGYGEANHHGTAHPCEALGTS